MTRRRLKILFTEGSSTSSREALYCLGPNHKIDILDPSRFCQSRFSRFVRRWYRCPSYAKQPLEYLRFLVRLLKREKYDVLFPTHEQIYLLSRVQEPLSNLVAFVAPPFDALQRLHDKASFVRLLDHLDLPYPETTIVRTRNELDQEWPFPRYVKLAHGTAGQAVWQVRNRGELQSLVDRLERAGVFDGHHEILVQQPVRGIQRDAGGMFQHGRMISGGSCEGQVIGVGGASMQRIGTNRLEMVEHVRRVGEHLHWHGPLGLAAIYDPQTDSLYYLEACPRIGETVPGLLAGSNPCETIVRMALGEPISPPSVSRQHIRTHQTFLILVTKALRGEGRFSIARELFKALRKSGIYAGSEDELTRPRDDWLSLVPATAVSALLLAYPGAARRLVRKTVENYSMPTGAADIIAGMSEQDIADCFR